MKVGHSVTVAAVAQSDAVVSVRPTAGPAVLLSRSVPAQWTVVRETVRNVALAVCGVLAVTLTAATLPTAFRPERSGSGGSGGVGTGDGAGRPSSPFSVGSPETVEIPFLAEIASLLFVVAALVALWYLFVNRRRAFRIAVGLLALATVGGLLAQFFSANPGASRPRPWRRCSTTLPLAAPPANRWPIRRSCHWWSCSP